MLSAETVEELEVAVRACDDARAALTEALERADGHDDAASEPSVLEPVGTALADWRDAQRRFMAAIEASSAPDPATAALLLKTNHGIDASNARRGLPGTDVDGADQPFDLDVTGTRGTVLMQAATDL